MFTRLVDSRKDGICEKIYTLPNFHLNLPRDAERFGKDFPLTNRRSVGTSHFFIPKYKLILTIVFVAYSVTDHPAYSTKWVGFLRYRKPVETIEYVRVSLRSHHSQMEFQCIPKTMKPT